MTVLKKTKVVAEGGDIFRDNSAKFLSEGAAVRVVLSSEVFEDMGEPETITVTVEVGDTLNDVS